MRKIENWESISTGGVESLPSGGYVAKILNIENDENRDYLKISYDIVWPKEYEGHYKRLYEAMNFWGGTFYRSYKESAVSMFKGFITSVEKSNQGFDWDWNEQKLKGKYVGLILQEEEYIPQYGINAGMVRTRLTVNRVTEIDNIKSGNFKVPELKKLPESKQTSQYLEQPKYSTVDIADEDLPF